MVERILHKNYDLLQVIHKAQSAFIDRSESLSTILQILLKSVMEITESEYGYIGKLVDSHIPGAEGNIVKSIAVATSGSVGIHPSKRQHSQQVNLTALLEKAAKSKQAIVLEDISKNEHQPFAFVGIPVFYKHQVIAVLGLAGCRIGYPDNIVTFLSPLADACAAMIQASSSLSVVLPVNEHIVDRTTITGKVVDAFPWAWYIADMHTDTILYANHAFCKLWNLEHLEFSLRTGELTHHSEVKPYLLRMMADRESKLNLDGFDLPSIPGHNETEVRLTNNKVLRVLTSQLENAAHQVVYVFEDITARTKQGEALIQAKVEAEETAAAKQSFLSAMSHEIRTPMNAVLGMTHLLLQENPRPEQIENLQTLKFSSENLLVLINDILDLSKIEAGKMIFEETDFDLKELVYNLKNSLQHKAEEKNIKINIRLDKTLPELLVGDPVRLAQVLNNLISNAVKFTEKGSVTIDVMLESDEGQTLKINFAVIDTGIGIAKDKLEYIFESFTQETTDITRRFGGTGLGLAITKRLLELQNSQIYVESSHGKGSVFYFTLAFKRSLKERITPTSQVIDYSDIDLSHVRLLLVEDNEINQLVATKFLKQLNIKPDYANNGLIAINKVQEKEYDLILMDLQMPEMGGYEATKAIRDLGGRYKHIPIIAVTAAVILDTRNRALAAGITDFAAKPINPNELFQKILQYVSQNKTNIHLQQDTPLPMSPKAEPFTSYRTLYSSLIEVCAGDPAAQHQIITLAIQSFSQFKTNYQKALLTKDSSLLDSAAHYMKTLFHMLKEEELIMEVQNGKKLTTNMHSNPIHLTQSVNRINQICDRIVFNLRQMSAEKISA
ncbi:ATP-binding protein [Rhodocytophaga aerolata]|uniref:histidine kinase n=1 Tax=Rhodocytophaga aerolata TaxID=455078 RepID=A0ABT8R198_9BACT|nr:ATP-binding protein [Rhodocytophaga aerolata]MDO1445860.1 ATP-binding protein [Rhodocytophaga aerolata]